MEINLIAAMDKYNGIGINGRLPWHLRDDLRRFRRLTVGHTILMGRKTFESIGQPLPGRINLVVTEQTGYTAPTGVWIAHSLEEALMKAKKCGVRKLFVAGGASLYAQALPLAKRFYLTRVHAVVPADTFFPDFSMEDWIIQSSETRDADEYNDYPSTFLDMVRAHTSAQSGEVGSVSLAAE